MPLRCQIITQERLVFDEQVDIVLAPASEGRIGVLPNHSPLIAALSLGELTVRTGGDEIHFAIGGGVIQVANNQVIVLADTAEAEEEIDLARADEARRRAEHIMAEGKPSDPDELAALEASIRRAKLRLEVGRRRRPRRGTGPGGMDFESGGMSR